MFKKEMFNLIATTNADNKEIVDFCNAEIALIEKRRASKKPTKRQIENEAFKAQIQDVLGHAEAPMTIAEIKGADTALEGLTTQRMSAILSQMVEDNEVVKTYDKKKAFFSLA